MIINMTNNFLAFWSSYYTYIRAIFFNSLNQFRLFIEIISIKIEKISLFINNKKGLIKDILNSL